MMRRSAMALLGGASAFAALCLWLGRHAPPAPVDLAIRSALAGRRGMAQAGDLVSLWLPRT